MYFKQCENAPEKNSLHNLIICKDQCREKGSESGAV